MKYLLWSCSLQFPDNAEQAYLPIYVKSFMKFEKTRQTADSCFFPTCLSKIPTIVRNIAEKKTIFEEITLSTLNRSLTFYNCQ